MQLKKNDRIRLTITDMSVDGEGIGKYDGLAFFVKNAVIGDEVLAVITRMKKGYGYAKKLEVLNASSDRVTPACPLAERCGGCQIMQLSYPAQLRFKEEKVRNHLKRIAGMECPGFLPIIGAGSPDAAENKTAVQPLHFRNKMQFPVGWDAQGHVVTGFYAGRTHSIIAAFDCPVSPEVNRPVLEGIREFMEQHRLSAYQEETGKGLVRHVLIRNGFAFGQIQVCLVINGEFQWEGAVSASSGKKADRDRKTPEQLFSEHLLKLALPEPWKIQSICLNINREKTNVILGKEIRCIYGTPYIEEQISSTLPGMRPLTFRINPLSFFQTNPFQTSRLYDTALKMAGLTGEETVWDLYCGTGTISLFLAQKARHVYGVEIIPQAIENARENAAANNISNAEFICGRSEEIFPEMVLHGNAPAADVVVLDPPRKGCGPELLEAIRLVGPKRIVYVSCDSATLARDLKILCAAPEAKTPGSAETPGWFYQLEQVQPVDMFPHTVHVETVVLMSRKDT